MAFKLEVSIIDPDGTIKVVHNFYGASEDEADHYYQEHIGTCRYLSSAVKDERVVALMEEIAEDEMPTEESKRAEEAEAEDVPADDAEAEDETTGDAGIDEEEPGEEID